MKISLYDEYGKEYQKDILKATGDDLYEYLVETSFSEQIELIQELIGKIKKLKQIKALKGRNR